MIRYEAALVLVLLGSLCVQAQEKTKPQAELPTYTLPVGANFTIQDVTIPRVVAMKKEKTLAFNIAGSLRVPKGENPAQKRPAVLWISGSGSQTRHGWAPQGRSRVLDIGSWEIHDAIAEAGFVVLSTDDRGIGGTPLGEDGVNPVEIGYDELVGDAQAALDWLKGRDEVDPGRIFIIGHSEGGLTAPLLVTRNDWVAGIICMSAMGRNLWEVTLDQVQAGMKNLPEPAREGNMKAQLEFMQACKDGRLPDFSILGAAAAAQLESAWKAKVVPIKAWWQDHFSLDVRKIHSAVACPVFVAQGEKDFQTSADKDARQILKDVAEGPCTDLRLKVYADLDHLLKPCGGRDSSIQMYFTDRRVDGGFVKDVVRWLKDHVGSR